MTFDLHVLSTLLAFILSQDQTLNFKNILYIYNILILFVKKFDIFSLELTVNLFNIKLLFFLDRR